MLSAGWQVDSRCPPDGDKNEEEIKKILGKSSYI